MLPAADHLPPGPFPLAPTLADEELAGWSMVASIGAVFLINLCLMLVLSICGLRRKLYLRRLRKKQEKLLNEKESQMAAFESNRPLTTILEKYTMEYLPNHQNDESSESIINEEISSKDLKK